MKAANPNFNSKEVENLVTCKFSRDVVILASKLHPEYPKLDFELSVLMKQIEKNIYIEDIYKLRTSKKEEETLQPIPKLSNTFMTRSGKNKRHAQGETGGEAKKPNLAFKCLFCEGQHRSVDCNKYGSIDARRRRLGELKRCAVCCETEHGKCTVKKSCRYCKQPDHAMPLCEEFIRRKLKKKTEGTFSETFVCTIIIKGKSTIVRGLLDNGSDTSYVHESVLLRSGVTADRRCVLNVGRYGSEERVQTESAEVYAVLANHSGSKKHITFPTTSCITGEGQFAPAYHKMASILPAGLHYADQSLFDPHPPPIEVLIGVDRYHEYVHLEGNKRCTLRFVLMKSFFGWIPSGSLEPTSNREVISMLHSASSDSDLAKSVKRSVSSREE